MVANQWSNDAMVMIHRSGLVPELTTPNPPTADNVQKVNPFQRPPTGRLMTMSSKVGENSSSLQVVECADRIIVYHTIRPLSAHYLPIIPIISPSTVPAAQTWGPNPGLVKIPPATPLPSHHHSTTTTPSPFTNTTVVSPHHYLTNITPSPY